MKAAVRTATALALLPLLFGCATTEQAEPAGEKVVYDYVYQTGSILPKKVRRGKAVDKTQNLEAVPAEKLESMAQDQMIRNMPRDSTLPGGG